MKQINYRIFRGEKSKVVKVTIPDNIFFYLTAPTFFIERTHLVDPDLVKTANSRMEDTMDTQYDITYDIFVNYTGIEIDEIDDITVEDYGDDKIIVHVYLDVE